MQNSITESEQMRRKSVYPQLENGFTHIFEGRSGFLYYKRAGRMLELYTEMSGVPEYDFLVWAEGLERWVYPKPESLWVEEKKRITKELVFWLRKQGLETNFKA